MIKKDVERFWRKVNIGKEDECWLWKVGKDKYGYGTFNVNYEIFLAHRIAYELTCGSIPDGLCVLHKCDNPPCCNPAHLFLGTRADNNKDKKEKGRAPRSMGRKGEANSMAKLTIIEVKAIREEYAMKNVTQATLARKYDVYQGTIQKIVTRKHWKHI